MKARHYSSYVWFLFWASLFYGITYMVFYGAYNFRFQPLDELNPLRLAIFFLLLPLAFKYIVQLISLPINSIVEWRRRVAQQGKPLPKVSVLVPAWNEEVGIIKTIESVLHSNYKDIELFVINDGSTDSTHEIVTQYFDNLDNSKRKHTCHYLSLPNGGKAKALNRALCEVSGDIIMTIDADSVMDPSAISKMVERFSDERVGAVAGNVVIGHRKTPLELLQQLEYLYGFFFKRADSLFNSVYIIGGAAAAYRREVIEKLGGFDESIITEDIELSTRILANGYKTRYAHDAFVYTEGPSDWKSLCKQRLRWKYGRILTFFKHKSLFFSTDKQHPKYLSWLLLPIAVYSELLLLYEAFLLSFFYVYTLLTYDFVPLVFVILFMSSLITVQVMCDRNARFHLNLLALAPIAWIVFYVVDVVEFQALVRSLKRIFKDEPLRWQRWARVGKFSASISRTL